MSLLLLGLLLCISTYGTSVLSQEMMATSDCTEEQQEVMDDSLRLWHHSNELKACTDASIVAEIYTNISLSKPDLITMEFTCQMCPVCLEFLQLITNSTLPDCFDYAAKALSLENSCLEGIAEKLPSAASTPYMLYVCLVVTVSSIVWMSHDL
jgi:hypothetical protein